MKESPSKCSKISSVRLLPIWTSILVIAVYFLNEVEVSEAKGAYAKWLYPHLKPGPRTPFHHHHIHHPALRHAKKLPLRAFIEIQRPNTVFRTVKKKRKHHRRHPPPPHPPPGPPPVEHVVIHEYDASPLSGPPPHPGSEVIVHEHDEGPSSSHEYSPDEVILHDDGRPPPPLPPSSAFDVISFSDNGLSGGPPHPPSPSSKEEEIVHHHDGDGGSSPPYGEVTIHSDDGPEGPSHSSYSSVSSPHSSPIADHDTSYLGSTRSEEGSYSEPHYSGPSSSGPLSYSGASSSGPLSYSGPSSSGPSPHSELPSSGHLSYSELASSGPPSYSELQSSGPPSYSGPPSSGPPSYSGPPSSGPPSYSGPPSSGPPSYSGPPSPGPPSYSGPPSSGPPSYSGPPSSGPPSYSGRPSSGPLSYSGPPSSGPPSYSGPPSSGHPFTPGEPVSGATPDSEGYSYSESSGSGPPSLGSESDPGLHSVLDSSAGHSSGSLSGYSQPPSSRGYSEPSSSDDSSSFSSNGPSYSESSSGHLGSGGYSGQYPSSKPSYSETSSGQNSPSGSSSANTGSIYTRPEVGVSGNVPGQLEPGYPYKSPALPLRSDTKTNSQSGSGGSQDLYNKPSSREPSSISGSGERGQSNDNDTPKALDSYNNIGNSNQGKGQDRLRNGNQGSHGSSSQSSGGRGSQTQGTQDLYNSGKSLSQVTLTRDPENPNVFSLLFDSNFALGSGTGSKSGSYYDDSTKSNVELPNEAYRQGKKLPLSLIEKDYLGDSKYSSQLSTQLFDTGISGEFSFGGADDTLGQHSITRETTLKNLLTEELLMKELLAKQLIAKDLLMKDHLRKQILTQELITRDLLSNANSLLDRGTIDPVLPKDPIAKVIKNVRLDEFISIQKEEGTGEKRLTLSTSSKNKFYFDNNAVKQGSKIYVEQEGRHCVYGLPSDGIKCSVSSCSSSDPLLQWNLVPIQNGQFWIQQKGTNYCLQPSADLTFPSFVEMKPCDLYESYQLWEIENAIPKDLVLNNSED